MNTYQAKLEAILARRLTVRQRIISLIKSTLWLMAALYLIPALLGMTWRGAEVGYGVNTSLYSWTQPLVYVFCTLNTVALLFLFVYSLIQCKKLLTRCLSGINEKR